MPYRSHPPRGAVAGRRAGPTPATCEEAITYALISVVGAIPLVGGLTAPGPIGAAATFGLGLVILGALGLLGQVVHALR
jgi:hypothetical protein